MSQDSTVYVGYARVSTTIQDQEGTSLRVQEQLIKEYCQKNGLTLILPICSDVISGTTDPEGRSGIQTIRRELKDEARGIICCKQDRLGRSFSTEIFMNKLQSEGVKLVLLDSLGIDSTTAIGKMLTRVKGAMGQFEIDTLHDRLRENIEVRRRNGEQLGTIPFGKRVVLDGKKKLLVPDADQVKTIELAKELRAVTTISKKGKIKEMSYAKICDALTELKCKNRYGTTCWYPCMIQRMLKRG